MLQCDNFIIKRIVVQEVIKVQKMILLYIAQNAYSVLFYLNVYLVCAHYFTCSQTKSFNQASLE